MNHIPRRAADCTRCHHYLGLRFRKMVWCLDHPDGADYAGPKLYEPSEWVIEVVGKSYRGMDGVFECTGYDPRCGFWMKSTERDGDLRNISERAIGRTYHRIWERV